MGKEMSEKRAVVEELSTDQYRTLIEETSDVISIVDDSGTILYQSPNAKRVKGWPREELLGETITDYIHPDDRERVIDAFQQLEIGEGSLEEEIEFRFRTKSGEWIWLATTGTAPDPEGPIDGFITTSREITERKEAEQELKAQRDDLELLNQVVRHDIRNDLQVVSTYAELLEDHIDEDGQEYLDKLEQSNRNAVELTRTARDLTAVILQSESETEPRLLGPIIEAELSEVRTTVPDGTVTVDGNLAEIEVLANDMLDSVFRNIFKNAVQHNDTEQPEITVSLSEAADTVQIKVADNGPGIPDEQKDAIFGKGEKGLSSDGSGVGLYLVREIVTGYGGTVWVTDNPDRDDGSVFVVELPTPT